MAELSAELCDFYMLRIAPGDVSSDLAEGPSCNVFSELLLLPGWKEMHCLFLLHSC